MGQNESCLGMNNRYRILQERWVKIGIPLDDDYEVDQYYFFKGSLMYLFICEFSKSKESGS